METVPSTMEAFLSEPLSLENIPSKEDVISFLGHAADLYDDAAEFPLTRIDGRSLMIASDLHGNLEGAKRTVDRFRSLKDAGREVKLLVLGDMVDRSSRKDRGWGPLSALYILGWKTILWDDIIVLRGNHEAYDLHPFAPYDIPQELIGLYGAAGGREVRRALEDLFDRLPLMAASGNGIAAVHASFPKDGKDPKGVRRDEAERVLSFLWGDPVEANMHRGPVGEENCFGGEDLEAFLGKCGCSMMVRGHTPALNGRVMYDGKLVTIHSTDYNERDDLGKVRFLEVSLEDEPLSSMRMFSIGKDLVPRPLQFIR